MHIYTLNSNNNITNHNIIITLYAFYLSRNMW